MSSDTVRTLSCGQGVEIQDACRRQNVTLAELKLLTSGDNLRRSIDFLNGVESAPVEKSSVLKALDDITVGPQSETFDHRKFFKTRKGLWVSDEFTSRTKSGSVVIESPAVSLKRFDLVKHAYDREIKDELPQNHEVQPWQIAKLIEAQEGGKDGPLLNNGYWNIFYVGGLAVRVYWHGDHREWRVNAWQLGDNWYADYRVFSSN